MKCAFIPMIIGLSLPVFSQDARPNSPFPDLTIPLKVHEPDKPKGFSLVITAGGFTQNGSTLEHGLYEIHITNRSGHDNLAVQLDRVSDSKTAEQTPSASSKLTASDAADVSRRKLRTVQKLEPGVYKLSVVNFPRWTFTLTVK